MARRRVGVTRLQVVCEVIGAFFTAFLLRLFIDQTQPLVPTEESLFQLAAVMG